MPASATTKSWVKKLADIWSNGYGSLFILHGNIHDLYKCPDGNYRSLRAFLTESLLDGLGITAYYDIDSGLGFASAAMQGKYVRWLQANEYKTPPFFPELRPNLKNLEAYFDAIQGTEAEGALGRFGALVISHADKILTDPNSASFEDRQNLVAFLKIAAVPANRAVFLITETLADLPQELTRNPHVHAFRLEFPMVSERQDFIAASFKQFSKDQVLPTKLAGLNLVQIRSLLGLCKNVPDGKIDPAFIAQFKQKQIEAYCEGLVQFKEPSSLSLDLVATHELAKQRLREIARFIREGKTAYIEKGILLPGRVGVGKSFLVDCFASECGLPVLELANFRSKWVGDTEKQLSKILLTLKALGPVVVVVDEADAALGNRSNEGDSGVSTRVFAALAAHIGDSTIRGHELWIAMTSRPDLMAIDMKRQGRFGLCIPLFPASTPEAILELFNSVASRYKKEFTSEMREVILAATVGQVLTGSEVEAIFLKTAEMAMLENRGAMIRADLETAINSYRNPLSPELLALQDREAVAACSDLRYLPPQFRGQK